MDHPVVALLANIEEFMGYEVKILQFHPIAADNYECVAYVAQGFVCKKLGFWNFGKIYLLPSRRQTA
jgi:hypothetical protein